MKLTKQARRDAKQLFRGCLVNGLLDENRVRQTVTAVIARKPRGFLAILSHFQRLVKLDLERRTARVESAEAVPDSLKTSVTANLAQRYGPGLTVTFGVNPALIGGLRVQVGSDVFDGSIRARLNALESSF
ncbi:MAG: F0F1 ATP synthase subunit delta [Verrucomicrobia bacterium]|nr:F0F1 ATP synthase subunit delta [Verrucomicrobiota bacterium]